MAKTLNEIQGRFMWLYQENGHDIDLCVQTIEDELLEFYNTQEGKDEINATPQRGLSPETAVDLLMQDIRNLANRLRG